MLRYRLHGTGDAMTDLRKAAEDLLEGVEAAIKAGDWKVDGACDPDLAIVRLRQALAQEEKPPVKTYCGGKPNYCTPEVTPEVTTEDPCPGCRKGGVCRTPSCGRLKLPADHPYRTAPVDAVNISQERVDEPEKREHEPVAYVTIEPALDGDWRKCPSIKWVDKPIAGSLYTAPPKREWFGLTEDDIHDAFNYVEMVKLLDFDRDRPEWCEAFARACEARLRHRNGENQ